MATLSPRGSYLFLKSLYFWFASATSGVKNRNFLPFNALGTPANSPTKVFPLPVADTTRRFSSFSKPSRIAKYWTGNKYWFFSLIITFLNSWGILSLFIGILGILSSWTFILSNNVKSVCDNGSNLGESIFKTSSRLPVFSRTFLKFLKTFLSYPRSLSSLLIVSSAHDLQINWLW